MPRPGPLHRALPLLALVAAVFMAISPLAAADPVGIRQGRHGAMGRLVFDFTGAERFRSHREGNDFTLQFTPAVPVATVPLHIPGLDGMQGGLGTVQLQLAEGAVAHVYRLGNRVVVDTSPGRRSRQPAARAAATADPAPAVAGPRLPNPHLAALAPAASPAPGAATGPPTIIPALPARPAAQPAPIPAVPAAAVASSAADTVVPVSAAPVSVSPPQVINFAAQPGAAAFRRGSQALLVFDTSEVPDLTALQSTPLFSGASLLSLQDAQVITIPLPPSYSLSLSPVSGGWQVAAVPATQQLPAPMQLSSSAVEFPMQSANQSIIITDPLTGGDLLVGTVTQAGDAADYTQSGPGYAVLPAWLGVVIVPQADDLGLNASLKGFELVSDGADGLPLGVVPAAALNSGTAAGSAAGQSLDLPSGSTVDLWQKLIADQRAAAILPALGRLNAQITLAQDMVALGFGVEAQGVVDTAVLENPAAQQNGQIVALRAVANVLAHRSQPADFTAPGIVPSPELSFWRAVASLDHGATNQAAPDLIAGLQHFEAYPAALRGTVAAEIAEALADAGRLQAARQLVGSDPANPSLDLARAKILEGERQPKAALAAYQALANGADQRSGALAHDRVVELQLAAGTLNTAEAADALDAQLFDWRAPEHERHLRLRVAELRAKASQWARAFTMLAVAREMFPDHRGQIDAARAAIFLRMLTGNAMSGISPIEAVAVLTQNQDLIQSGNDTQQVINLLAQRLEALDLPGTAAPVLSRLIQTVPEGPARAGLGATLAQVDLQAGSPAAALSDLSATQADNLPQDLATQRSLLAAKAQAAGGNAIAAVNTLAPVANPPTVGAPPPGQEAATLPALAAQAQIAEQSGQWPRAEQALSALVGQSVPATGKLGSDQENLLLRLATAASHDSDSATLAALNTQYGGRVGADPAGQMFQTLTAPPLTGDQGLNQALHEIAQLQALPAMVNAVAANPAAASAAAAQAAAAPATRPSPGRTPVGNP